MEEEQPFGIVHQATQQTVLIHKNLVFQDQNQIKIIQKMCNVLASLENEHLEAFIRAHSHHKNTQSFQQQYVPLSIDKWLLDLGEDVLEQLEFELTTLAVYLTDSGVKFAFDPKFVGLSKDIKVKYVSKEFSIDYENKLANYKDNQKKISNFFQQLKNSQRKDIDQKEQSERSISFGSARKVDSFKLVSLGILSPVEVIVLLMEVGSNITINGMKESKIQKRKVQSCLPR